MNDEDLILGEVADIETMKKEKALLHKSYHMPIYVGIKMKGNARINRFRVTAICKSDIDFPIYEADEWKLT